MSKSQPTGQKTSGTNRNGVRPKYIALGTDADGATHTYRTTDRAVIVVSDGARDLVETLVLDTDLDDWMDYVAAQRGWADRQYGIGLVEHLADQLEGQSR